MKVNFYDAVADELLMFAVIITKSKGKWVFCKHRDRDTYEVPGGHREPGENIDDTARRELYFAEVFEFEEELHSEIEKIILTDELVENWTYPEIQPHLVAEAKRRGFI